MDIGFGDMMLSMLISTIGTGYLIYGKKRPSLPAFAAGLAMCIFPYFVSGVIFKILLFAVCLYLPFVI